MARQHTSGPLAPSPQFQLSRKAMCMQFPHDPARPAPPAYDPQLPQAGRSPPVSITVSPGPAAPGPQREDNLASIALDGLLIVAITMLTLAKIAPLVVFVALIGPLMGARLSIVRVIRPEPPQAPGLAATGAVMPLLVALAMPFRRMMGG